MRPALYFILPLVALASLPAARAELKSSAPAPSFSNTERAVIARNALLRDNIAKSPWLVRRILDRLKSPAKVSNQRELVMPNEHPHLTTLPEEPVDQAANPDLANLDRSSTEAAYDLFQLLKEAGKPAPKPVPVTRSK